MLRIIDYGITDSHIPIERENPLYQKYAKIFVYRGKMRFNNMQTINLLEHQYLHLDIDTIELKRWGH